MSDATPAYRGYRLQNLYTLARILESHEDTSLVFQPEGAEDFAVWNKNNRLLETVQVKAYSGKLTLSSLSPDKVDSFLYRAMSLLNKEPDITIKIASFGEIGIELLKATQEDGKERIKVAKKISEYKDKKSKSSFLSEKDAQILLNQLEIEEIVESKLEDEVFTAIRNLCTGIDPTPAFEILSFWLYCCAENKTKITQNDVIKKINDIGQFIAERNAHHKEWFRSIFPIENNEIDIQLQKKLSDEFYRGISARYEHILANVDKPRHSKLKEIAQKFKEKQVVIIHGASGQGKTTIAYRYLHDFFPEQWRFQIRLVENRQQALNIATALSGKAKVIGIPIAVYLDVSPNDLGWEEIIKQLSSYKNIQILVTIREEDFRRASISGVEIQFAEVELQFEKLEAEEIYQFLVETEISNQFLDFEDAWNRFGGNGPLMEFVYLVNQGDSLRERLQKQIKRIEDEVRSGKCSKEELQLLRLVSVASAFEARLKLKELVNFLNLPSPKRTLELLEKEYLLRISENGNLVSGLHPIRSTIISEILTDPTFEPWVDSAKTCLPFILEQDIGSFLLYAFSRHQLELEPLLSVINNYQPRQWVAIAGVTRALIWLGIKEYVKANEQLILEAYEEINYGWLVVLDSDIVDVSEGLADGLLSSLSPLMSEEGKEQIVSLRNRQTDKKDIFIRVYKWLSKLKHQPIFPKFDLDWVGMAEVLFWIGYLQISLPIQDWLNEVDFNLAVETLTLEILSDIALGLFYGNEEIYHIWLNENKTKLIQRFQQETKTLRLEDDGQNIKAHFVLEMFDDTSVSESQINQKDSSRKFVNASMKRLNLLRKIFPNRKYYGSQGYGHKIWNNFELYDDTQKNIPQSNFHLQHLVSLNSTFIALGDWVFRPNTFKDYATVVFSLRQKIVQVLKQLKTGLNIYFRRKDKIKILGEDIDSQLWSSCKKLRCFTSLPKCTVDEWGFVSERIDSSQKENSSDPYMRQNLIFQKYKAYLKTLNQYIASCSNFFEQGEWILNFHPYIREENTNYSKLEELAKIVNIDLRHTAHLSVANLGETLKILTDFQKEFDHLFSPFLDSNKLVSLKRLEQEVFKELWMIWYFFAFNPNQKFPNSTKDCTKKFNAKVKEIRKNIKKELKAISSEKLQVNIFSENIQWEGKKSLWIKIDGENAFEVYGIVQDIIKAIQEAINSVHNNKLRYYAIDFTWSNFVIVPLVKGKSLDATAWKFSSILFSVDPNQEFNQLNFIPVEIPADALSLLKLSTWNHPRLKVVQKFMALVSQLSILTSHIKDFERSPEIDKKGRAIFQDYIKQISLLLGESLQVVLDVEVEIGNYFNNLSSLEQSKRPYLIKAMEMLLEIHQQILPKANCSKNEQIQVSINFEEIVMWANRLSKVQDSAFLMYLFWISDVLEEIAK